MTATPKRKPTPSDWLQSLAVYFQPKLLVIFALGFSAGLPYFLTGSTLNIWMKEEGISLTTIGFFALVGLPYVAKPLWAPLVDSVRLPILHGLLGRRRSWLVFSQGLLIAAILTMGGIDPVSAPAAMALAAVATAFASATQDIVIDTFRIEYLDENHQAAGVANYVAAYRIAMMVSMSGSLFFVTVLQDGGWEAGASWRAAYALMAVLVLVGTAAVLLAKEPEGEADRRMPEGARDILIHRVIHPFTDFLKRPYALAILAFILFFKFGDALAGTLTAAFVIDLGFTRNTYGSIVGLYGMIATLSGGFLAGYIRATTPLLPTLWIAGILQMLSNFVYVWLAMAGQNMTVLIAAVTIENLTGGFGTVIFVAYISGLCTNRDFTATQFALLTALTAVGRVVFSAWGGWIVDASNWTTFFLITVLAALPGLAFLWFMQKKQILEGD